MIIPSCLEAWIGDYITDGVSFAFRRLWVREDWRSCADWFVSCLLPAEPRRFWSTRGDFFPLVLALFRKSMLAAKAFWSTKISSLRSRLELKFLLCLIYALAISEPFSVCLLVEWRRERRLLTASGSFLKAAVALFTVDDFSLLVLRPKFFSMALLIRLDLLPSF